MEAYLTALWVVYALNETVFEVEIVKQWVGGDYPAATNVL